MVKVTPKDKDSSTKASLGCRPSTSQAKVTK